jgi:cytochrome bd-type quinol oxidase subunit 2
MFALNGDTLLYYFPFLLVLVTFELSLSVYKSSGSQWTTKLASGNLIVNLIWIALLLSIVFNPNLFNPEFVPYMVEIYDSTAEKVTLIINLAKTAIVLAVIVTNTIDVYTGFNNIGVKEKT